MGSKERMPFPSISNLAEDLAEERVFEWKSLREIRLEATESDEWATLYLRSGIYERQFVVRVAIAGWLVSLPGSDRRDPEKQSLVSYGELSSALRFS